MTGPALSVAEASAPVDRSAELGERLLPVAERMVTLADVQPGQLVLVASAGNGSLSTAARTRGGTVAGADSIRVPWSDGLFHAVLGFFSVSAHPDPRAAARELIRVARPGAPIVLATWGGRPWSRYDTAHRHFFGFPELDVTDHELPEEELAYSLVFARKP